jgi:hypothetical protein
MKKILFCLAVCAMALGFASCEPIDNEHSPLVGHWTIEGNTTRTIEFDHENATVTTYDNKGEVYGYTIFEYIINRKKVYFGFYTADLQWYVHECDYRFDGDNYVIITGLNPILYYGSATDSSYNPNAEVTLKRK